MKKRCKLSWLHNLIVIMLLIWKKKKKNLSWYSFKKAREGERAEEGVTFPSVWEVVCTNNPWTPASHLTYLEQIKGSSIKMYESTWVQNVLMLNVRRINLCILATPSPKSF